MRQSFDPAGISRGHRPAMVNEGIKQESKGFDAGNRLHTAPIF
jgi:hypothetical protein